ncbi:hypothetical protein GOBAR_DD04885 [Gossypium barbadense]|nr:hypothetical protein GOBAR_DD04885 [Gossypium barbadense]
MNSLYENAVSGDYSAEGLIPKKVHFRDKDESVNMDLLADHVGQPTASWKENLVGSSSNIGGEDLKVNEDFEVLEGDIQKSIINGIQCILIQDMKKTVILKLLGCNIGFSILQNRIYSLWKPSLTVHLMDIENGFFLAEFVNKIDYEKVLFEGESSLALGIKLGQRNGSPNGLVVSTDPLFQDWGVEEFGKKSLFAAITKNRKNIWVVVGGSSNSGSDLINDGVDINLEPFSHPSLLSKEPVDVTEPVETVDDLNSYRHT